MVSLALLGEAPASASAAASEPGVAIPHVVAWNLTRRCNLECAHCYIAAGPDASVEGELSTTEVQRIADQIFELNPSPMFILSGGEPLLRDDLCAIAAYASGRGATVVVGTNGTLLTDEKISALKDAGVTGVAVSVESLHPTYHDRFRRGHGALADTLAAVDRLVAHHLDFIVQTTFTKANRDELPALAAWAADKGAVSFNAYFLVRTGRGAGMGDLTPNDYETLLGELVDLHVRYLGRMLVRAKCAPQFMRLVHQRVPDSPLLQYSTRCPCGVQYCRVTPDGKLTACPYLPVSAGDLRSEGFAHVWRESALFTQLRQGSLDGKCGQCEYRQLCGGCRARAYAETGDVLGADPSCAYEPDGATPLVGPLHELTYGMEAAVALPWSEDARARMRRVPSFVRGVVMRRVEDYARRRGEPTVTMEVLRAVRTAMPVDFSKRKPFFLDDDA